MSRRKPSSGPPDPSAINPISIKQALAVAEHLSFRAAARALGVRHSAVSRRVRTLEEKLGVTLFERHLTGVTLTNAGDRFFQQAREGFAHLDRASRTAATAGRGEMGQLRIGILSSMGAGFLRDLIQSFCAAHPDVAIQIHEAGSADHISLVRKRQLDIAFVPDAGEAGDCDVAPLWIERVFVVLPEGHALTHHKVIEWRSLRNQHLIIRQSNCSSALCERIVKHLSGRARTAILHKVNVGRETVMHLVAMGRGVSLTSEATIATPFPGVVFRPLAGVDATLQFSAVWWPKNGDPAFRRFLSVARALAKQTRQLSNHGMARHSPQSGAAGTIAPVWTSSVRSESPSVQLLTSHA